MKRRALSLVAPLLIVPALALALPASSPGSDSYEALLGDVETEAAYDQVLHLLDAALKQPVNLLTADRDEIAGLPGVSPSLADEIVGLRSKGELKTLGDIRKLPGANDRLLEMLGPFVIVRPLEKHALPAKSLLRLRVIGSPPTSRFTGSKTNGVYEVEARSLSAGIVVDKDKGEARLNDFQAFYVEKAWGLSKVIVGNFLVTSGHGLVFSDAFGQSPSTADPWRVGRGAFGIKTSTASRENSLMRGVGASLTARAWALAVVASRADFDVRLDASGRVTSLNETGTHVARAEVEGRDALREDIAGVVCRVGGAGFAATASLAGTRLNRDFAPDVIDWARDRARFAGSLDLSLERGDAKVFAEGALGGKAGAALAGLAVRRPHSEVLVLGRSYAPEYVSLHAAPFAFYSGLGRGERGLLTVIKFKPAVAGQLSITNDLHQELRADGGFRASGSETFVDLTIDSGPFSFALGEKLATSQEPPPESAASGSVARGTRDTARLRSRVDLGYTPIRGLSLRARYEVLTATEAEAGATGRSASDVLRLDLSLAALKPLKVDAGFYAFSVADWASRVYQYEAGVPYYPTLELLKSDGSRWYAAVSWDAKSLGKIAVKFGRTLYEDGEEHSELLASYMLRM
jgi:hypothetical protein